ncbi:MAG TPA: Xaa-Pro peptidase family protein [Acidobacteriota bacterium]|nr:Xaa-Pro peptidase family protein [Acidobacteriota bacterium]HJO30517.1 Xaa-Pro peptidase family protein [Acidobacteriota bacterium]
MTPIHYLRRRNRVLSTVADSGLDGALLTRPVNVRYLTGFTGTNGWLLVTAEEVFFLTDPRYQQQAFAQVSDLSIVIAPRGLAKGFAEAVINSGMERVAFEPHHVTVILREQLEAMVDVEWVPFPMLVETQRCCKEAEEIEAIRAALLVSEAAFQEVANGLAPGQTEIEVASDLELYCRRHGAESMAFETIVASGSRSALPHGVASTRCIEAGEPIMIDLGCKIDGYCSDLTRMIWCGGMPSRHWLEVHDIVNAARAAALETIGPGIAAIEVDAAAREVIQDVGFGPAFVHGTGHGVGLEIHESPKVSSRSNQPLEVGMVLTIEPGLYLEGEFGIRIEDLVCVTEDGCECLTTLETEPMLRGTA